MLPPAALSSLRFLVDGVPVGVERFAPYDVAGGSTAVANPFDVRPLPDGLHTLTSEFAFAPSAGGYVERVDTPLRIENRRTENGYVLGVSGSPGRRPARYDAEPTTRWEYWFVLNYDQKVSDPLNPRRRRVRAWPRRVITEINNRDRDVRQAQLTAPDQGAGGPA